MMSTIATRPPLEDATNSQSTSPTVRSISPDLHHKRDIDDLHTRLDSSEASPSPHGSIYDASVQSETETPQLDALDTTLEDWPDPPPIDPSAPAWEQNVTDADGNIVPASFLLPLSPGHTPHRLDPIKEQNSSITLRSRQSGTSTLKPRSSALLSMHKRSFSTTDLPSPVFEQPQQDASSSSSRPPSPLPQPNRPVQLPPQRPPTPADMPTFGSPEALTYRLPAPRPKRFRDRFKTLTPEQEEWHRQTAGLPKGVVMRGEDGTLVRGRFRPIRSGHLPDGGHPPNITVRLPPGVLRRGVRASALTETTSGIVLQRRDGNNGQAQGRERANEAAEESEERRHESRRRSFVAKLAALCCPPAFELRNRRGNGRECRSEIATIRSDILFH